MIPGQADAEGIDLVVIGSRRSPWVAEALVGKCLAEGPGLHDEVRADCPWRFDAGRLRVKTIAAGFQEEGWECDRE